MDTLWPYLGNLHTALSGHPALVGVVLIGISVLSGMLIGTERERRDKPAGLRTVSLIAVGSTIFTLASIYIGGDGHADVSRIAAQVAPGIGFLGAGAILRDRGVVIGMTTAATIWVVAAIGVLIGTGYAAAGLVLSLVVVTMLTVVKQIEDRVFTPCRYRFARIVFAGDQGKAKIRLRRILDRYNIPASAWNFHQHDGVEVLDLRYCDVHRQHRAVLAKLIQGKEVKSFEEGNWDATQEA